jgi:hypothetical protein
MLMKKWGLDVEDQAVDTNAFVVYLDTTLNKSYGLFMCPYVASC